MKRWGDNFAKSLSRISTYPLEIYMIGQLIVWIWWLCSVQKVAASLPFWLALESNRGVRFWIAWAVMTIGISLIGFVVKRYSAFRIIALGSGLMYWIYLAIVIYIHVRTALLPWFAVLSAMGYVWCLLHRIAAYGK